MLPQKSNHDLQASVEKRKLSDEAQNKETIFKSWALEEQGEVTRENESITHRPALNIVAKPFWEAMAAETKSCQLTEKSSFLKLLNTFVCIPVFFLSLEAV